MDTMGLSYTIKKSDFKIRLYHFTRFAVFVVVITNWRTFGGGGTLTLGSENREGGAFLTTTFQWEFVYDHLRGVHEKRNNQTNNMPSNFCLSE